VNSSMAPTRFFILYPTDPDMRTRVEVTGTPRVGMVGVCAHILSQQAPTGQMHLFVTP
jgi:hypothetical protein